MGVLGDLGDDEPAASDAFAWSWSLDSCAGDGHV